MSSAEDRDQLSESTDEDNGSDEEQEEERSRSPCNTGDDREKLSEETSMNVDHQVIEAAGSDSAVANEWPNAAEIIADQDIAEKVSDAKQTKKQPKKMSGASQSRKKMTNKSKQQQTPPTNLQRRPTEESIVADTESVAASDRTASFEGMVRKAMSASEEEEEEVAEVEASEPSEAESLPPATTQVRDRNQDITADVNGMKTYGVVKGQVQRAVVKFHQPPDKQPLTVCFHFPGTFLTHRYVLDMMRNQIRQVDGARVKTIQFVDRNTIHGTQGLYNRWLVAVNLLEAAECLVREGFYLYNRHIGIRHYDDVLAEEYEEYQEYLSHQDRLNVVRQKMLNVAHGDSKDYEELSHITEDLQLQYE